VTLSQVFIRSTAIRWNFREYRFPFTLHPFPAKCALRTVSIQGFSPLAGDPCPRDICVRAVRDPAGHLWTAVPYVLGQDQIAPIASVDVNGDNETRLVVANLYTGQSFLPRLQRKLAR
jgi:hypothetical protein